MDQILEKIFSEAGAVASVLGAVLVMIQREKTALVEYYRTRDENYLKIIIGLNDTLAELERKMRQ